MAGLLYLKHACNLSDKATCERWLENWYWQCFTGEVYFQTRLPCDPSFFTRWRNRLGEAGLAEHLAQTIEAAKMIRSMTSNRLRRVILDTTAREKSDCPSDRQPPFGNRASKAREACATGGDHPSPEVRARRAEAATTGRGGYADAKQFKCLKRVLRRQRKVFGRVIRDIERKIDTATATTSLRMLLERAEQLRTQHRKAKNNFYALHAPEVGCISKGKSRQPYEFGVKVGIAARFPAHKTVIVTNSPRLAELVPLREVPICDRPRHFAYVGTINDDRSALTMVRCIDRIEGDDIRLRLAGLVTTPRLLSWIESEKGWMKVVYDPWLSRYGVRDLLNHCRTGLLLINPIRRDDMACMPIKMCEYMAASIPIIASNFPLSRQIVEEEHAGLVVDALDENAIVASIQWLIEHPADAEQMGTNGRRAVLEKRNWDSESIKLLSITRRALGLTEQ